MLHFTGIGRQKPGAHASAREEGPDSIFVKEIVANLLIWPPGTATNQHWHQFIVQVDQSRVSIHIDDLDWPSVSG